MEFEGTVIRTGKMAKTCTVSVERKVTDHKTLKVFTRHTKLLVHDPNTELVDGDVVLIRNCRRVSARKHFEFVSLIKGSDSRQSVLTDDAADVAELAQEKTEEAAAELAEEPTAKKAAKAE
ncbi:small subunit ribosomal protein S17 [Rhodotorula toruloides]|uniref:Small subunit ribosomal protein S17 n=1 Tax=Rhodotorula toruloides TaxID=5286 RepID=A0A511K8L8_RHOTO|nr:small subunit ribosomal protein S17 [Rhodotorula toruloides]